MIKEDCIFCKIANGGMPSRTIYEDEQFRVILDLAPASRGHALILPKEHFSDLSELPEEWCQKAFCLAKRMAALMTERLHCDGFNIVQNNGEIAGQTVYHFHIHLIPVYQAKGRVIDWTPGKPGQEELDAVKKQICQE